MILNQGLSDICLSSASRLDMTFLKARAGVKIIDVAVYVVLGPGLTAYGQ